jgi:hypothetical protein
MWLESSMLGMPFEIPSASRNLGGSSAIGGFFVELSASSQPLDRFSKADWEGSSLSTIEDSLETASLVGASV